MYLSNKTYFLIFLLKQILKEQQKHKTNGIFNYFCNTNTSVRFSVSGCNSCWGLRCSTEIFDEILLFLCFFL